MVLLGDKIKEKIQKEFLIIDPEYKDNYTEQGNENYKKLAKNISHASYNIRVGKKAVIEASDETIELNDYEEITLKPFEVAIIETYEIVNIPTNLIARWNIRVSLAYKGLIWVGGPQVDPGYKGHLYCPIYNMSDKDVKLSYKDAIATMDFVETTEPTEDSTSFSSEVKPFEAYKKHKLKSALTTHMQSKLDDMERFKDKMEERLHKIQTIFLTIMGSLFATLSILIITMKSDGDGNLCSYVSYFAIGISVFSLLLHNGDIVSKNIRDLLKKVATVYFVIVIAILLIYITLRIL